MSEASDYIKQLFSSDGNNNSTAGKVSNKLYSPSKYEDGDAFNKDRIGVGKKGYSFDAAETFKPDEYLDSHPNVVKNITRQGEYLDSLYGLSAGTHTKEDVFARGEQDKARLQAFYKDNVKEDGTIDVREHGKENRRNNPRNIVDPLNKDGVSYTDLHSGPDTNLAYNTSWNKTKKKEDLLAKRTQMKKETIARNEKSIVSDSFKATPLGGAVNRTGIFLTSAAEVAGDIASAPAQVGLWLNKASKEDIQSYKDIEYKEEMKAYYTSLLEDPSKSNLSPNTINTFLKKYSAESEQEASFKDSDTYQLAKHASQAQEFIDTIDSGIKFLRSKTNDKDSKEVQEQAGKIATSSMKYASLGIDQIKRGDYAHGTATLLSSLTGVTDVAEAMVKNPDGVLDSAVASLPEAYALGKKALVTMTSMFVKTQEETLTTFAKLNGREPDAKEVMVISATSIIKVGLDKGSADIITKGIGKSVLSGKLLPTKTTSKILNKVSPTVHKILTNTNAVTGIPISKLLTYAVDTASAEFVAEGLGSVATQYGAAQDVSKIDGKKALTAGITGAMTGPAMGAITTAGSITKSTGKTVNKVIQNNKKNSYDSITTDDKKTAKDVSQLTAKQVNEDSKVTSIGKFDIPLSDIEDKDVPLTSAVQRDVFFNKTIKETLPDVHSFITSKGKEGDLEAAINSLASEYSSVPSTITGKSKFDTEATNTLRAVAQDLTQAQATYNNAIKAGKSPTAAYDIVAQSDTFNKTSFVHRGAKIGTEASASEVLSSEVNSIDPKTVNKESIFDLKNKLNKVLIESKKNNTLEVDSPKLTDIAKKISILENRTVDAVAVEVDNIESSVDSINVVDTAITYGSKNKIEGKLKKYIDNASPEHGKVVTTSIAYSKAKEEYLGTLSTKDSNNISLPSTDPVDQAMATLVEATKSKKIGEIRKVIKQIEAMDIADALDTKSSKLDINSSVNSEAKAAMLLAAKDVITAIKATLPKRADPVDTSQTDLFNKDGKVKAEVLRKATVEPTTNKDDTEFVVDRVEFLRTSLTENMPRELHLAYKAELDKLTKVRTITSNLKVIPSKTKTNVQIPTYTQYTNPSILSTLEAEQAVDDLQNNKDVGTIYSFYTKLSPVIHSLTTNKRTAIHQGELESQPINSLLVEGVLPKNVVMAISLISQNFINHSGTSTINREEYDIGKLLGYSNTDITRSLVPVEAITLLKDAGLPISTLAGQLGKQITQQIGVKVDNTENVQDGLAQEKLEINLGMIAINAMSEVSLVQTNVLQLKELNSYAVNEGITTGAKETNFIAITVQRNSDGSPILSEYGTVMLTPRVESVLASREQNKTILSEAFDIKNVESTISETPIENAPKFMKGTVTTPSAKLLASVKAKNAIKYITNTSMMDLMNTFSKEDFLALGGAVKDTDKSHISRLKGIDGKNAGLLAQYNKVKEFLKGDLQEGFYIPHSVWNNGRGGDSSSSISLQKYNMHRYLFQQESWTTTLDPKNPQSIKNLNFSLMQALDTSDDAILEDGSIASKFKPLVDILNKKKRTPKDIQTLVNALPEKYHSLAGLNVLNQYEQANGSKFSYTLPSETDGVSNGVILAIMQIANSLSPRVKDLLAGGGVFIAGNFKNMQEYNTLREDNYRKLARNINTTLTEGKVTRKGTAIDNIFGALLDEDGNVTSNARKLFKASFMNVIYGEGPDARVDVLVAAFMENMYTQLEDSSNNLEEFNRDMSTLLDTSFKVTDRLNFNLTMSQKAVLYTRIQERYGEALELNIHSMLGDIIENRRQLTSIADAIQAINTVHYNKAIRVASETKAKLVNSPTPLKLTREERKTILISLREKGLHFGIPTQDSKNNLEELQIAKFKKIPVPADQGGQVQAKTNPIKVYPRSMMGNILTTSSEIRKTKTTSSNVKEEVMLDTTGQSVFIMTNIAQDALIASTSHSESGIDALDVFDAGITNPDSALALSQTFNKAMYDTIKDYSIVDSIEQAYLKALKSTTELSETERKHLFSDKFNKNRRIMSNPKYDGPRLPLNVREEMSQLKSLSTINKAYKKELFKEMTGLHNFDHEGGILDLSNKKSQGSSSKVLPKEQFATMKGEHVTADKALTTLDTLRTVSEGKDSKEHTAHLEDVMHDLVLPMLKHTSGITQKIVANNAETLGEIADLHTAHPEIRLQLSSSITSNVDMSPQEVYTHELIHAVVEAVKTNPSAVSYFMDMKKAFTKHLHTTHKGDTQKMANDLFLPKDSKGNTVFAFDQTKEEKEALERLKYMLYNPKDAYQEFVTFVTTNEYAGKIADKVTTPKNKYKLSGTFVDKVIGGLKYFVNLYLQRNRKTNAPISKEIYKILMQTNRVQNSTDGFIRKGLDKANIVLGKGIEFSEEKIIDWNRSELSKNHKRNPMVKALSTFVRLPINQSNADYRDLVNDLQEKFTNSRNTIFHSLYREMTNSPDENRVFEDTLNVVKGVIENDAVTTKAAIVSNLHEAMGTKLSDTQWRQLNNVVLKTSLHKLHTHPDYSNETIVSLLSDYAQLTGKIKQVEDKLQETSSAKRSAYYNHFTSGLGEFMATGVNHTPLLMLNANAIVNMQNLDKELQIVHGFSTEADLDVELRMVEELITLQALKHTSYEAKAAVASIAKTQLSKGEGNGFETLLQTSAFHDTYALQENFDNDPMNTIAGYTSENYDSAISMKIESKSEQEYNASLRYFKASEVLQKDPFDTTNQTDSVIYLNTDKAIAPYSSGAVSLRDLKSAGTSFKQISNNLNSPDRQAASNATTDYLDKAYKTDLLVKSKSKLAVPIYGTRKVDKSYYTKLKNIRNAYDNSLKKADSKEKFDDLLQKIDNIEVKLKDEKYANNNIVGFRYMMDEQAKTTLLKKDDKADQVLGTMMANIKSKTDSAKSNKLIVQQAKADYDTLYSNKTAKDYVFIHKDSSDTKLAEIYRMLPTAMKEEIKVTFPDGKLPMRNANMEVVFGYRDPSIANSLRNTTSNLSSKQKKMYDVLEVRIQKLNAEYLKTNDITKTEATMDKIHKYQERQRAILSKVKGAEALISTLSFLENFWKIVVSNAKRVIVLLMPVVVTANIVSNLLSTMMHGISIQDAIKDQLEGLQALHTYQNNKTEYKKLELKLKLNPNHKDKNEFKLKIGELKSQNESSLVHDLIQRGAYQTIAEDLDIEQNNELLTQLSGLGNIGKVAASYLEKAGDNVPAPIRKTYEQVVIAKNTTWGKTMANITQYSDFVARYSLYKKLIQKDNQTKQQAFHKVMDVYVAYTNPTNPALQWLNSVGGMMFTKFMLRVQKVILKALKSNPADVLALDVLQRLTTDIPDITDSILTPSYLMSHIHNPLEALKYSLDANAFSFIGLTEH